MVIEMKTEKHWSMREETNESMKLFSRLEKEGLIRIVDEAGLVKFLDGEQSGDAVTAAKLPVTTQIVDKIRSKVEAIVRNSGGWSMVNGGYAVAKLDYPETELMNDETEDNDYIRLVFDIEEGEQDMGDGCSRQYNSKGVALIDKETFEFVKLEGY